MPPVNIPFDKTLPPTPLSLESMQQHSPSPETLNLYERKHLDDSPSSSTLILPPNYDRNDPMTEKSRHFDPELQTSPSISQPKKRYCCGCFSSRKGCILTWFFISFLILVAIGLTLFFCWPRIQSVSVGQIQSPSGNQLFFNNSIQDPIQALKQASTSSPFIVTAPLLLPLTIVSESYISYTLSDIQLILKLLNNVNKPLESFSGTGNSNRVEIEAKKSTFVAFVCIFFKKILCF
jgi:hypothetical protein